jgi:hypothetical protein
MKFKRLREKIRVLKETRDLKRLDELLNENIKRHKETIKKADKYLKVGRLLITKAIKNEN